VVIDGDVGSEPLATAIEDLAAAMDRDPGLGTPEVTVDPDARIALLSSTVPGDPATQDAQNTVRRLRSEIIPESLSNVPAGSYEAFVGGASAEVVDLVRITTDYTPLVFAAVLSLSFLLMLVAFRSLVIAAASIVMNLLSVGAAYGMLVLVFQKGFLIDVFQFQRVDQIEFFLPLFMFTILFGLSMDYQVFMLSRMKERYDETGDHPASVAFGLNKTARLITGAALIMVAVFGGFALGEIAFFESFGFGLGSAVLLDATIVRSLLLPSVLKILGTSAWYMPSWLEWIPNISIEGQPAAAVPPDSGTASDPG
jgi:RND superfamily putative drug exporter